MTSIFSQTICYNMLYSRPPPSPPLSRIHKGFSQYTFVHRFWWTSTFCICIFHCCWSYYYLPYLFPLLKLCALSFAIIRTFWVYPCFSVLPINLHLSSLHKIFPFRPRKINKRNAHFGSFLSSCKIHLTHSTLPTPFCVIIDGIYQSSQIWFGRSYSNLWLHSAPLPAHTQKIITRNRLKQKANSNISGNRRVGELYIYVIMYVHRYHPMLDGFRWEIPSFLRLYFCCFYEYFIAHQCHNANDTDAGMLYTFHYI